MVPAPARRARAFACAALLAALQAALLLTTAWDKSDTADEPTYLVAGALAVRHGEQAFNMESPLLPKRAFGLALAAISAIPEDLPHDPRAAEEALLWRAPMDALRRTLLAARATTVAVCVLAGLLLWRFAERLAPGSGLLAQALWAFSPNVLASGSLATLDAWAAAGTVLVAVTALDAVQQPTAGRGLRLGLAAGLAAACKVTTLGAAAVAVAILLWAHRRRAAGTLAAAAAGATAALWVVYGLSWGPASWSGGTTPFALPFAEWWSGLLEQFAHGARGHRTYLFGEHSRTGFWWFYLGALAVKTTIGAQALFALGLAASWWRWRRGERLGIDAALLAYPLLLVAVMSAGRTQNGLKYLLPAFPLVFAWLATQLGHAARAFGPRGRAAVLALGALSAGEALRLHPHHLMFFNLWAGGPEGGPRYLVVGDDWGQDQRRLGAWQREQGLPVLYYTRYTGHPESWGIRYQAPPCSLERSSEADRQPRRGYYALHAVEVHRPRRIEVGCLDWLTVEPPDARIGYSIYLYAVDRGRLERLRAGRGRERPFWRSGG